MELMKPAVQLVKLSAIVALTCVFACAQNTDAPSGPTPTGTPAPPQPQLQKAEENAQQGLFYLWNVENKDTVGDNFGHYIANRYYVIELLINNQLDKKVIITGAGFKTKQGEDFITIAATDPQTIKGVLVKKDMVGRNARIKSLIKMTGLMLTGASGFFKAAGSAATYNRSINIYNDPFQKGLELVDPNTITNYLETLNSEVFKTGLVLAPGSMGYLRVFVDQNNIDHPSKLKIDGKEKNQYDPIAVQKILNELVLQGQKITNSESVTFEMKHR
jgi:hypothetical protein